MSVHLGSFQIRKVCLKLMWNKRTDLYPKGILLISTNIPWTTYVYTHCFVSLNAIMHGIRNISNNFLYLLAENKPECIL